MDRWVNMAGGTRRQRGEFGVLDLYDPETGKRLGTAPSSGPQDVDVAVTSAAHAFREWSGTTPGDRQELMLEVVAVMRARAEELIEVECRNTGMPKVVMRAVEFPLLLDQLRFFAGAARCATAPAAGEYQRGHLSYVRREPLGVCAQIAPSNYPLTTAVWKMAPAVLAGNTVVLKPAEATPASVSLFAQLAGEVLPPGVFNVVCGDGRAGEALVAHPLPAMISFTGSASTGKAVAAAAASGVKRVQLELGGKAPAVVFGDADLGRTAAGLAEAAFANAGQNCVAASRVIAADGIRDELAEALAAEAAAVVLGGPDAEKATCGPLVSAGHHARVTGFLRRLPDHARILHGGDRVGDRGNFLRPAVVSGVRRDDEIARHEVFGPVVSVEGFTDEDDVVDAANHGEHGLAASVWTGDAARGTRVTARLGFGAVGINSHGVLAAEMPHGGFKQSGYGKDLSIFALEEYTRVKHVLSDQEWT